MAPARICPAQLAAGSFISTRSHKPLCSALLLPFSASLACTLCSTAGINGHNEYVFVPEVRTCPTEQNLAVTVFNSAVQSDAL